MISTTLMISHQPAFRRPLSLNGSGGFADLVLAPRTVWDGGCDGHFWPALKAEANYRKAGPGIGDAPGALS